MWRDELLLQLSAAVVVGGDHLASARRLISHNRPEMLFRYRPCNEFTDSEILNGTVWSCSADKFNDPYDCALILEALDKVAELKKARFGKMTHCKDASKITIEYEHLDILEINRTLSDIQKNTKISCLSEKDDSLLMWSHYARNHSGVCLGYSLGDLSVETLCSLYPVIYRDEIPSIPKERDGRRLQNEAASLLCALVKSRDWEYEREWRLIYCEKEALDQSRPFRLPKVIILGSRISSADRKRYIEMARKQKIEVLQATMKGSVFELEHVEARSRAKMTVDIDLSLDLKFAFFRSKVNASVNFSTPTEDVDFSDLKEAFDKISSAESSFGKNEIEDACFSILESEPDAGEKALKLPPPRDSD